MASIMNLHLQYRLWIAEMNADINVLRIFDDYLAEMALKDNSDNTIKDINNYKEQFINLRKELDDLRHEMHLNKMKLAAFAKVPDSSIENVETTIDHEGVKERYEVFKKKFAAIQIKFREFVSN